MIEKYIIWLIKQYFGGDLSKVSKEDNKATFKDVSWVSILLLPNKSNPSKYEIIKINTMILNSINRSKYIFGK